MVFILLLNAFLFQCNYFKSYLILHFPVFILKLSELQHFCYLHIKFFFFESDDSKFGQRMLEKFGWSKGCGLGKNKQGISENLRVEQKLHATGN